MTTRCSKYKAGPGAYRIYDNNAPLASRRAVAMVKRIKGGWRLDWIGPDEGKFMFFPTLHKALDAISRWLEANGASLPPEGVNTTEPKASYSVARLTVDVFVDTTKYPMTPEGQRQFFCKIVDSIKTLRATRYFGGEPVRYGVESVKSKCYGAWLCGLPDSGEEG